MKPIKVEDSVHSKLIKLTTSTGTKKTISKVIEDSLATLPYANLKKIQFDDIKGKILVADFYLSEDDPNPKKLSAELCIELEKEDKDYDSIWKKIGSSKKLEVDIAIGDKWGVLKCDDFIADVHYGNNVIIVSLFIDDYIKYFKEDKKNAL